ncbi:hypothetical protein BKE38_23420 [Pseudoroseomonas deserti]|uniref:Uncharacterized protein n=1 Tax=Teichococcus deserti TaxID=1817963 RepID=A0A1V2GW75_9PROT|nr:hypothetical protein [Pseudoroseomonas deserti]ONG47374.1 hypothetical protein BKE38_23420 [Pseudoroseomonas deserti]
MSAPHPLRPDAASDAGSDVSAVSSSPGAKPPQASALPPGWRELALAPGGDRVTALLAFALAQDAGDEAATRLPQRRAEAEKLLGDWSFRHLHNHAESIRQEAARGALAGMKSPPGFLTLVVAGFVATLLAGGLGWVAITAGWLGHLPVAG